MQFSRTSIYVKPKYDWLSIYIINASFTYEVVKAQRIVFEQINFR